MKCSLLTLSTFIDGELAPPRHAEVDAHLVGCSRCSAGAATLREEKSRVGQLARVTVDPGSAQLMLEQVGITLESVVDRSPIIPPPPSAPADVQRPWQSGDSSRALPWTPRRPQPTPVPSEPMPGPVVAPAPADVQPDLPLDGVRSVPPSWDRTEQGDETAALAAAGDPAAPPVETGWVEADEEWLNAGIAADSWEADLPPSAEPAPAPAPAPWDPPQGEEEFEPGNPTRPLPAPPTRLASASGPAALWTRVRDAVTVRLALARGSDALEDSLQIVSGAPSPRHVAPPTPLLTDGLAPAVTPPAPPSEVELNGVAGQARPAPGLELPPVVDHPDPVADRRMLPRADPDQGGDADITAPAAWNAFAASSYAIDPHVDVDDAPPPSARSRPIGRHSRAVAREGVPLTARLSSGVAALASATRDGASSALASVRQGAGTLSRTGPDSRLLAGIAGIGLIFVIALIVGHSSGRPVAPPVARPSAATAAAQPHATSAAKPGSAATAPGAPAAAPAQAFGAGNTGFQVIRLRYGAQAGYMRVVFDLGAVSGTAAGTPKVTVSYSGPSAVLVTFAGTLPAGSTATPTPGRVISSVTLVSSSGGRTVYRFGLTRAATATAFYLASPTRFVLDLH